MTKNKYKYSGFGFVCFFLVIFSLVGCKSSKILTGNHPALTEKQILKEYKSQDTLPSNLNLRFSSEITYQGNNQSATVFARIKKDSAVWLSVRSMSFEGFRMILTKDSIKFIDKINSKYFLGTYNDLKHKFPIVISYDFVQQLLLGQMIDISGTNDRNLQTDNHEKYYCLVNPAEQNTQRPDEDIYPFSPKFVTQRYLFHPTQYNLAMQLFTSKLTSEQLKINYGELDDYNEIRFYQFAQLTMSGFDTLKVYLKTKSVSTKKSLRIPFKIPNNYQIINF